MSFNLQNWGRLSTTMNTPLVTLTGGAVEGAPAGFTYQSATETLSTISAANYFVSVYYELSVGDFIYIVGSDANACYSVTTSSASGVTITAISLSGPIGTANILDGAVTSAKIASGAVGTTQLATGAVTSAKIDPQLIQFASGTLSSAQLLALYTTPIQLLAAPGANLTYVPQLLTLEYVYNSVAYSGGGNIYAQYGNTAHGTNVASGNISPTGLTDQSASTMSAVGIATTALATSVRANAALYLTNATAVFAAGNGTLNWYLSYRIVATN